MEDLISETIAEHPGKDELSWEIIPFFSKKPPAYQLPSHMDAVISRAYAEVSIPLCNRFSY
jgi:hypothetical protein